MDYSIDYEKNYYRLSAIEYMVSYKTQISKWVGALLTMALNALKDIVYDWLQKKANSNGAILHGARL